MTDRAFSDLMPDLEGRDFEVLEQVAASSTHAEGTDVVLAGDEGACLHTVRSGTFEVLLPVGEDFVQLRELQPGDTFGEDAFADAGTRVVTVRATRDAELLRLDRSAYDAALRTQHPGTAARLQLAVARQLAERLRASSCVRVENIDDDPMLEVVSCLSELCTRTVRPTRPFSPLSVSAYRSTARPAEGLERVRGTECVASVLLPLGREVFHGFAERMDMRCYADGAAVVEAGSEADGIYLVLDGQVDVEAQRAGPLAHVGSLDRGRLFGHVAFLLGVERSATCRAAGDALIGIVGGHTMQGLMRYAAEGRRAGEAGLRWIARETARDWRAAVDSLVTALDAR